MLAGKVRLDRKITQNLKLTQGRRHNLLIKKRKKNNEIERKKLHSIVTFKVNEREQKFFCFAQITKFGNNKIYFVSIRSDRSMIRIKIF